MLDMGTADHSAEQIARYFDSIGGHINMSAGRFTVFGSVTSLKDDFAEASSLFAECFTQSTFPQEEYAKIQQLALGAIARRASDPHQEISEFFADNLPPASPFHLVQGGKAETVRKLTAKDLRDFHARYFVPNNMIVAVFGDIEPDAALDLVKKEFGGLKPAADFKPLSFDRSNAIAKSIERHKSIAKETGMVMLGCPTSSIFEKEDYAAMTVLNAIMAGYRYPGGWLHEELRGEGLVYAVHAMQQTGPVPGYFVVVAQTRPDKIDEVVSRIRKNLNRAKEGDITEQEFATAKQRIIAFHAQEGTTIAAQAQEATIDELYGLGYDYRKTFDARIEAVQLADVVRAAKKYLGGNQVLVTASPEKK
jgi:zinc protease